MAGKKGSKRRVCNLYCKNGHRRREGNFTKEGSCLICKRETSRKSRRNNLEKHREFCLEWARNNRDKINARRRFDKLAQRNIHLKTRYGITLIDQQRMLDDQKSCCKICRDPFTDTRRPEVDHRHDETRAVRGLLCHPCNIGIGAFFDNPDRLLAAIYYLEAAPAYQVPKSASL